MQLNLQRDFYIQNSNDCYLMLRNNLHNVHILTAVPVYDSTRFQVNIFSYKSFGVNIIFCMWYTFSHIIYI